MRLATLLVCIANFALIAALPRIFFRPGRLHVRWWLTALPLFAAAGALLAAAAGAIAVGEAAALLGPVSLIAATASMTLIVLTVRVHRVPLALWHQEDDAPVRLVTEGPYAVVRHPFYSAFLLALLGAAAAVPAAVTVLCFALGAAQLHRTAVREEKRLLASTVGAEYGAYMRRTGRFGPRVLR